MSELYLTAYDGKFLGPIAKGLGWIMNWIYVFMVKTFGIENIALTIIIFTLVIYLCLFPLTYQQQKFAMLSRKMQPELNAIQKKYKDKKDQQSMAAQQEETQAVYDKYGISPMGSCVQALIQMPILFALYRVFYNVPAYISNVKAYFTDLVSGIMSTDGYADLMQTIYDDANLKNVKVDFTTTDTSAMKNYIVDVTYRLGDSGWDALAKAFPNLTDQISSVEATLHHINYFTILNISDTPLNLIKQGFSSHYFLLSIVALLIPVLAYLTQVLNIKMTPTTNSNDSNDQMAQQMKTMNMMMPIMSLVIAFTVPVGLGLYWIAGAVIRFVQQFFLNKHFEKINLDDIVEKNKDKAKKKAEKRGERAAQIYQAANMNTKSNSMASKARINSDTQAALDKADELRKQAPAGSMASKANMVKNFNEKNNK